nr:hypothetical protein [Tanacetum cinerariifolium]
GSGFPDLGNQVLKVFQFARVGVVIREVAVDVAKQRNDFTVQGLQQLRGDHAGSAIAAIDHNLQAACQNHVIGNLPGIEVEDVDLAYAAFACGQLVALDAVVQRLDLLVRQR